MYVRVWMCHMRATFAAFTILVYLHPKGNVSEWETMVRDMLVRCWHDVSDVFLIRNAMNRLAGHTRTHTHGFASLSVEFSDDNMCLMAKDQCRK